jgi:hypothetical protein
MAAPPLPTALAIGLGLPGWLGLATISAAAAFTTPVAVNVAVHVARL